MAVNPDRTSARREALERYNKACGEAAKQRDVNRALRAKYRSDAELRRRVRGYLVTDLLRVHAHPDNPYAGWSASRKRYRALGHYPEIMVTDLFGTHAEFERAAGLADLRGTQAAKNQTARLVGERAVRRYAEREVMRSAGRWASARASGISHVLVCSDLHSQFVDPLALRVWLDVVRDVKPDLIVFNGDLVDFPAISRYSQIPGAGALSLQSEIDFVRKKILRPTRERAPKAAVTYHIGNHEQRLVRYLADTAPALADLRCLRWDELFGIEEYGIEMVFGGDWLAPTAKARSENIRRTYRVYYDTLVVTHGKSIAKNAMEQELRRFGLSGTSGHTHRPGVWTQPTLAQPFLSWTSTGMMAGFAVGKSYVDGPSSWTMGFGVFTVDPGAGLVVPQPVLISEDFATFGGRVWRPSKRDHAVRREMWGENGGVTGHER